MSGVRLEAGFIPLVDAAPLIIARELGYGAEEGLDLTLRAAPSWSTLRDLLVMGQIEAAHMLAPVPVAMALGLGGMATRLDALMVLSVNGDVIGVSTDLAAKMRANGYHNDFSDARAAGKALIAASETQPRIGVPFPFSMHADLLYYWLGALGMSAPQDLQIKTVPPPLMAQAMEAGEIDAFCVGAPWGSIAVEDGVGELLLPGAAIWRFAPEKVLAVRHDWTHSEPDLTRRLMRAVWRAGRWLSDAGNTMTASEILARPEYLNVSAEVIERELTGRLVISPRGELRSVPNYLEFFRGAATFPWKSQAAWIASRLAARTGLDRATAMTTARDVFRSDLYRRNLRDLGAVLPGASEKLEGSLTHETAVATENGNLILQPDAFFDAQVFDPYPKNAPKK
ncbi:CmpA/NrtA family ABC transporter substrate-binding protein [Actibacterium sp.]|uniref:CmpA/NrtA family ABC transporter substrate-binding protein n=1 Tax=Actibacterium sp. TaxID=1872125 RepID=UPI00356A9D21